MPVSQGRPAARSNPGLCYAIPLGLVGESDFYLKDRLAVGPGHYQGIYSDRQLAFRD
jgi:hypothetical protein